MQLRRLGQTARGFGQGEASIFVLALCCSALWPQRRLPGARWHARIAPMNGAHVTGGLLPGAVRFFSPVNTEYLPSKEYSPSLGALWDIEYLAVSAADFVGHSLPWMPMGVPTVRRRASPNRSMYGDNCIEIV